MERVEIKTSQLWLASYLDQYYPVTYADFEIEIGRPNTPTQIKRFRRKVRSYLEEQAFDILAISCWTSLSYRATLAPRAFEFAARKYYDDWKDDYRYPNR